MPKNVLELGRVVLSFDTSGKVEQAIFKPAEHSSNTVMPEEFSSALMNLSAVANSERAAAQALAAYFVLIGNIESHDPEKGTIKQRVLKCEDHANKVPHKCEILFYYERTAEKKK